MSKADLRIARFRPEDQDAVRALILAGLEERWGAVDPSLNPDLDDIAAIYADSVVLVAWTGNEIVGAGCTPPLASSSRTRPTEHSDPTPTSSSICLAAASYLRVVTEDEQELAKATNREVWALLERTDRTSVDDERMVQTAHSSAHHWQQAGGALESARADWLLSHVYAVVGRSEEASRYAQQSLATCEANGFGDFDLAYAYEAVARSAAAGGDGETAGTWRARAKDAAGAIADDEDRELFLADLAADPWFNA